MAQKAKTPASEFLATLKSFFTQLSEGERTPSEVAGAFNEWAREGAEAIKAKISEEVELTVSKMGFIKRDEYEKLLARVEKLEANSPKKPTAVRSKRIVKKIAQESPKKSSSRGAKKAGK